MSDFGPAALEVFNGIEVLLLVVAELVGFDFLKDGSFLGEVVALGAADVFEEFTFLGKEFVAGAAETVPYLVADFAAGGTYCLPFSLELQKLFSGFFPVFAFGDGFGTEAEIQFLVVIFSLLVA